MKSKKEFKLQKIIIKFLSEGQSRIWVGFRSYFAEYFLQSKQITHDHHDIFQLPSNQLARQKTLKPRLTLTQVVKFLSLPFTTKSIMN